MSMQMFNRLIIISSEDDKYRVCGGIGTYLGLLARTTRELYPEIEVIWITLSPDNREFTEGDENGVLRHYLSAEPDYLDLPFANALIDDELVKHITFQRKLSDRVYDILADDSDKKTVIEVGEWEGHGAEIFNTLLDKNILKVTRLHTPLATCIKQNSLNITPANKFQLISEYLTISQADCISSSTEYMRKMVIRDVLGESNPLAKTIIVRPNPVDTKLFESNYQNKKNGINLVNKILNKEFLTDETFNVFIVGSVEPRKGVDYNIAAIPAVLDAIPSARFCFIGHHGGNKGKNVTANTKTDPAKLYDKLPDRYHKYVEFTDYVDHKTLSSVISAGDVFPIMSLGDNFPGVVAEISLSEKPIIAVERGGVKEMLQSNEGVFVAQSAGEDLGNSSQILGEKIIELYNKPEERTILAKKLKELILFKYEPNKVTRDIISTYSQLLYDKLLG